MRACEAVGEVAIAPQVGDVLDVGGRVAGPQDRFSAKAQRLEGRGTRDAGGSDHEARGKRQRVRGGDSLEAEAAVIEAGHLQSSAELVPHPVVRVTEIEV